MKPENEEAYLAGLEALDGAFHNFANDPATLPPHKKRVSRWDEMANKTRYLVPAMDRDGFEWVPVPTPRVVLSDHQIEAAKQDMDLSDCDVIVYYDDPRLNGATVLNKTDAGYKIYGDQGRQESLDTSVLWPVEAQEFFVERAEKVKDGDELASGWEDHSYLEIDVVPMKYRADGDEEPAEYADEVQFWSATAKIAGVYFNHPLLAEFEAATEEKIDQKVETLLQYLPGAEVHKDEPILRPVERPAI